MSSIIYTLYPSERIVTALYTYTLHLVEDDYINKSINQSINQSINILLLLLITVIFIICQTTELMIQKIQKQVARLNDCVITTFKSRYDNTCFFKSCIN